MLLGQLMVVVRMHCALTCVHSLGKWGVFCSKVFILFLPVSIVSPDLLNTYFIHLMDWERIFVSLPLASVTKINNIIEKGIVCHS